MIKILIIIMFCYIVYGFIKNLVNPRSVKKDSNIIDADFEEIE